MTTPSYAERFSVPDVPPPQHRARLVLPWLAVAVGVVLGLIGIVGAFLLGPSGRVESVAHISAPGLTIIDGQVLRAASPPVTISATTASGGRVTLVTVIEDDATGMIGGVRHATIESVSFLPRRLAVTDRGDGRLNRALNVDAVITSATTSLTVSPGTTPIAVMAVPGEYASPKDEAVDVTLAWEDRAWFLQALSLGLVGTTIAVVGWRLRPRAEDAADEPVPVAAVSAPDTSQEPNADSNAGPSTETSAEPLTDSPVDPAADSPVELAADSPVDPAADSPAKPVTDAQVEQVAEEWPDSVAAPSSLPQQGREPR